MAERTDFYAELVNFGRHVHLHMRRRYNRSDMDWDTIGVAKPVVFEQVDAMALDIDMPPAAVINTGDAQKLMDELWRCGLRPSEGTGSAGALAATERHLNDMRALVFKGKQP